MVQHKPTPEEQLLKLIEGGTGAKDEASGPSAGKTVSDRSKSTMTVGKIPGFLEYGKKLFSKNTARWNSAAAFDIKNLNRALLGLVILSAVFLLIDLIFFKPDHNSFLSQVSTNDAVYPVRSGSLEKISEDISIYKNAAKKRNPFLPPSTVVLPGPADSGVSTAIAPGATGSLAEAIQAIKLVGISWSENNPLAMIEDVSTGRTFFLRKGQEIKGIKVQNIDKEKVAVTYQGQEGDLF